ncbi:plastocyanin/azurin family copper-binding protein [Halarchaeum acidiphilum]|uniref:plastocyanin/azurin family copper-binding protein n=1 Tax=Halarchaeum acidiphilum TaxID=489138 RepID=UPI000373A7E2|nr:plastocyanin/azurin family copper-binding protein [Halarchaeum acidiphilum]
MRRRSYLASLGALGASALAGCGGRSAPSTSTTSLPPDTVECDLVDYAFRPGTHEPLTIDAGTTVRFVWKTSGHNIVPKRQPDGADWAGVPEIYTAGHTDDYTFTVPGRYRIVCEPHVDLGMVGNIVVTGGETTNGTTSETDRV